ncbi:formimidoylglutamate deiminase [Sphingopyxis granuli]|uniref:formimidoylglutamate deiminase n=1 Tax=Sphingopyxis granuli TaxID=267128 RepID=UPI000830A1A6|nr:formimidoylglutamate deiminase [Sphingopyxis granuli]
MQQLWFRQALLPDGWQNAVLITHDAGRITRVEPDSAAGSAEVHAVALPGLCNVHSHAFQRGMAGLSERGAGRDDDFWSWREVMYRFLARMTPDDVAAVAAQAYAEMLESGFTRVGEFHYLHHDPDGRPYADAAAMAGAIVAACDATGIGLTLLPVFYAHGNFGGAAPSPGQKRFLSSRDGFARLVEASRALLPADATLGIAPHSLRAVTPAELAEVTALATDGPIHIHAAEQQREVDDCLAWSGRRPVEWLLDEAGVDARWCLIHATHLTDAECDALAARGAVAGLCPVTEANLGDGIFPATRYLRAGGRFGVGTDSNIAIDLASELRALEYSQRLRDRRRVLLAGNGQDSVGRTLFDAALAGGAQALGVTGGLSAGAPADMVNLDMTHPTLAGADPATLLDRWIFAGRTGPIDRVWRGGRLCVEGGRHVAAPAIAARYTATLERLLA